MTPNETRTESGHQKRATVSSALGPRLRLFALLGLLVPLFGGLQAIIRDGIPRVEVRVVPREVAAPVPVAVPVEVPVERVVERVVYVTVDRAEAQTSPEQAGELSQVPTGGSLAETLAAGAPAGEPGTVAAGDSPGAETPVARAPETEQPALTGLVAVAPLPLRYAPPAPDRAAILAEEPIEAAPADEAPAPETDDVASTADQSDEALAEGEVIEESVVAVSSMDTDGNANGSSATTLEYEVVAISIRRAPRPEAHQAEELRRHAADHGESAVTEADGDVGHSEAALAEVPDGQAEGVEALLAEAAESASEIAMSEGEVVAKESVVDDVPAVAQADASAVPEAAEEAVAQEPAADEPVAETPESVVVAAESEAPEADEDVAERPAEPGDDDVSVVGRSEEAEGAPRE